MRVGSKQIPELGRKEVLTALAVALALAVLVLWPVAFTDRVPVPADAIDRVDPWRSEAPSQLAEEAPWNPLITDSLWQVVPEGIAVHGLWSQGLPLWDPEPSCGVPAFAQGRMYSNPIFNLTARITGPLEAIGWTAMLQLTMALWGAYLLARQLGVVPAAAAVAAVAYGFNLYLMVWLPHTSFFGAMVWLPLVFFAFERVISTGRLSWMALGATVFAIQILEGHIATPFFGAITLGIWSAVRGCAAARSVRSLRAGLRPVAVAAGLLVGGALLAAPQILATAELFFQTPRGHAVGRTSVIDFEQGLRAIAPWFWGHRFHGGTYMGPFNVAELGLYFGVLPLALIFLAPLGSRRLEGWFFSATAVLCGLVVFDLPPLRAVLGWIYPILYQSFPGRIFVIAAFAGSVAAGLGAHWLLVGSSRRQVRRWTIGVLLASVFIWAVAAWVALFHRPAAIEAQGGADWIVWLENTRVEGLLWAGGLLAVGAVAMWFIRLGGGTRPALQWALAIIAAVDLLRVGAGTIPFYSARDILPPTPTIVRLSALLSATETSSRIVPLPSQQMIPGQVPSVFDLPSVSTYSSWPLTRYDRYASLTGMRYLSWPLIYFNDCCSPMMNALGSRFIVAPDDLRPSSLDLGPGFDLLQDGDVRIWENPMAMPRARVVHRVRWMQAGDIEAVGRVMASGDVDLRSEVVLEGEGAEIASEAGNSGFQGAAILLDRPTRVEVEVDVDRPGVLVLADTWYPGWEATVNGQPAEVFPANLALRGVPVPEGRSLVVFSYRPAWLIPGLLLSLLGVVFLVGSSRIR